MADPPWRCTNSDQKRTEHSQSCKEHVTTGVCCHHLPPRSASFRKLTIRHAGEKTQTLLYWQQTIGDNVPDKRTKDIIRPILLLCKARENAIKRMTKASKVRLWEKTLGPAPMHHGNGCWKGSFQHCLAPLALPWPRETQDLSQLHWEIRKFKFAKILNILQDRTTNITPNNYEVIIGIQMIIFRALYS